MAQYSIVQGDLLDQRVDVIVNAWNRNFIPWRLLLPQGVSGAIKKRGGTAPFRELGRIGIMRAGAAATTGAGSLPFKAIIHVAGLNAFWRSSESIVRACVRSAMGEVNRLGVRSVGFPIIGAGTGGVKREQAKTAMIEELRGIESAASVLIVEYRAKD
ncbi:MAG: macro domain-containing protein [Phycisphaerales bacterium]|jgi:O-acetyl-ADP-ribose deacetylase (regulator of RNase III)|nr:macro domain-containing protein [Phycisphaerales bacterium]